MCVLVVMSLEMLISFCDVSLARMIWKQVQKDDDDDDSSILIALVVMPAARTENILEILRVILHKIIEDSSQDAALAGTFLGCLN
jgi:hypothetical protein